MNVIRRIIAWAMISLILQIAGLVMLEKLVFRQTSYFKSEKMEIEDNKTKDINAVIPTNAESINISYKGKYLTYYQDGVLYMEDTKTGTKKEIKTEDNGQILYYKWLPDRDRLVIAEKVNKDGVDVIKAITYDPKDSSEKLVDTICNYREGMKVKKISVSPLIGVYYFNIDKGGKKSVVYRRGNEDTLKKVSLRAVFLGNIEVIPHMDRLVYEDEFDNTFFATSPEKRLKFKSNGKLTLLGVDRQDVIYMGELNGTKISSLIYGKVDENTSNWKTVTLNSVVDREDLYFNNNSEILLNDNLKGSVKNLTTGKEIEYEGKLLEIKEGFIATVDSDGKLKYVNLEENKK